MNMSESKHHQNQPNWLWDNEFLIRGHRSATPSLKQCIKSVFEMHTETGNIWSHFIGINSFFTFTFTL